MARKRLLLSISTTEETLKRWRAVKDATGTSDEALLRFAVIQLEGPALDGVREAWNAVKAARLAAGIPEPSISPRRGRPRKQSDPKEVQGAQSKDGA